MKIHVRAVIVATVSLFIVALLIAVVIVVNPPPTHMPEMSENEAILRLTDTLSKYKIELGKDGEELWWDLSCLDVTEIENEEAYVVDLRYGPNIESVMSGRRFGTYAISKNGSNVYMHNIVTGGWEPLN